MDLLMLIRTSNLNWKTLLIKRGVKEMQWDMDKQRWTYIAHRSTATPTSWASCSWIICPSVSGSSSPSFRRFARCNTTLKFQKRIKMKFVIVLLYQNYPLSGRMWALFSLYLERWDGEKKSKLSELLNFSQILVLIILWCCLNFPMRRIYILQLITFKDAYEHRIERLAWGLFKTMFWLTSP